MATQQAELEAAIKAVGYAAALRMIAEMMARDAADHTADGDEMDGDDDYQDDADQCYDNAEQLERFAADIEGVAEQFEEWDK